MGFIVFVPLKKIILGVIVTIAGTFFPTFEKKEAAGHVEMSVAEKFKLNLKGTPKWALLVVGILIVASALLDGIVEKY
jgi:hypothetical protein